MYYFSVLSVGIHVMYIDFRLLSFGTGAMCSFLPHRLITVSPPKPSLSFLYLFGMRAHQGFQHKPAILCATPSGGQNVPCVSPACSRGEATLTSTLWSHGTSFVRTQQTMDSLQIKSNLICIAHITSNVTKGLTGAFTA